MPRFKAGAHIDVRLSSDLVRQYSLCSHPDSADLYEIAVKREPESRGGSAMMHEQINVGDVLEVSRPRNNFSLNEKVDHHVLLAGGIGITPLLSMARQLGSAGKSFQLEYFARSTDHAAFYEDLGQQSDWDVRFHIGLEADATSERLRELVANRPSNAHAYVCGPRPFIDKAIDTALAASWPEDAMHFEHFSGEDQLSSGVGKPFKVTIASTGQTFDIPADRSILQVLKENGVPCDSSCAEGVCGSCMAAVLEGEIDHRDSYLTPAEKKSGEVMMICVSRSVEGDLVIDI